MSIIFFELIRALSELGLLDQTSTSGMPNAWPKGYLPFPNTWPWRTLWRCFGTTYQLDDGRAIRHDEGTRAPASQAENAWVTQMLQKVWPYVADAVDQLVRDELPGLIEDHKPKWLGGIEVARFNLGQQAPEVDNIQVDQIDDDGIGELRLVGDVEFASDTLDLQLIIQPLPPQLSKSLPESLQGFLSYISSTAVGLRALSISAKVFVMAKPLQHTLPIARTIQVALVTPPEIDFRLTLTQGETNILNLLKPWLRRIITLGLDFMTLPEHISIPLEPGMPDVHKPEALLVVWIKGADEMPVMDLFGHADTYVDAWVRSRVRRRTPIKFNNAHPRWSRAEATFQLLVHTRQYQALTFELWDWDAVGGDDFVGTCALPLRDLEPMKVTTLSLPVLADLSKDVSQRSAFYAGATSSKGSSKVDPTRLLVQVQYIPATMADSETMHPGVLSMKLKKVTVPSLTILPLYIQPYIINQPAQSGCKPKVLRPMIGKDADRLDIEMFPVPFDCAWDILGDRHQVGSSSFILELLTASKGGEVVARVEVTLSDIMSRKFSPDLGLPGTSGGGYILKARSLRPMPGIVAGDAEFLLEMQLLWHPLLHHSPEFPPSSPQGGRMGQGVARPASLEPAGVWKSYDEI